MRPCVHVGTTQQEQLNQHRALATHCVMQRRQSVHIARVHARATIEQNFNHRTVIVQNGAMQRRLPILIHAVQVNIVLGEQRDDGGDVSLLDGDCEHGAPGHVDDHARVDNGSSGSGIWIVVADAEASASGTTGARNNDDIVVIRGRWC